MQRERKDTHTHMWALNTKTETNRREQQTEIQKGHDSYSPSVSHCKSQFSVLPPSRCPSLSSCVDIRLVQKGSAQLIAGPLRVGDGVLRGETWLGGGGGECVGVCVGTAAQGLGGLPWSIRYGGQRSGGAGHQCAAEEHDCCAWVPAYASICVCLTLCDIAAKMIITF